MTTIAYDGKTLAVDSLVTSGTLAFGTCQKLFKLKNGSYAAIAGSVSLIPEILSWLQGGPRPVLEEDDALNGIVVDTKGHALEFGNELRLFPACVPWGGGSGGYTAMVAMRCGKSAVEAVEVACEMDVTTRGPVQAANIVKG